MIETVIKEYIQSKLDVPIYFENDESNLDNEYIVIERTSGGMTNHISSGTFAFQSYSTSLYGACSLDEELRKAVFDMIELDSIARVELDSYYNYTDTTKKKYRYQAVFYLVYYD